jgi:tetratricopeptide (TPR) repeat protein
MLRHASLVALALVAGVLVMSFSLAISIADTRPGLAAAIAPYLSTAKSRLAEVAFAMAVQGGHMENAEPVAQEAALLDPLNAAPIRTLAYVYRDRKEEKRADRFFAYALRLTRRDIGVDIDYVMEAVKQGDAEKAIHYLDLSLRTSRAGWDRLFPIMYQISGDPTVVPALANVLRNDPQWKWPFLDGLVRLGPNPVVAARLIQALEAHGPLVNDDLYRALIGRLIDTGHYSEALARYRVLAASKGVHSLTNGDFERRPLALPFEWTSILDDAIDTGVGKNPDKALGSSFYFKIPAGSDGELLRLLAVTDPGPHRLLALVGPALRGVPGDLTFDAECLGTGATIGHMVVARPAAGLHAFPFTVPSGCQGIRLYLRASADDSGDAWVSWLDQLTLQAVIGATAQ